MSQLGEALAAQIEAAGNSPGRIGRGDPAKATKFKADYPNGSSDIHALFLKQIADDPQAQHVAIADQAGFHLSIADPRTTAKFAGLIQAWLHD